MKTPRPASLLSWTAEDWGLVRYRDRWERWLRTEIESAPVPSGVDAVTAWAVATMIASYANSDGSQIEVSLVTLRRQLRIGTAKLDRTVQWLEDYGLLATVSKHGRRTATRRALRIPNEVERLP